MKDKTQARLLNEFIRAITKAHVAAWSIASYHSDPRFLPVRDKLERVKNKAIDLTTALAKKARREGPLVR